MRCASFPRTGSIASTSFPRLKSRCTTCVIETYSAASERSLTRIVAGGIVSSRMATEAQRRSQESEVRNQKKSRSLAALGMTFFILTSSAPDFSFSLCLRASVAISRPETLTLRWFQNDLQMTAAHLDEQFGDAGCVHPIKQLLAAFAVDFDSSLAELAGRFTHRAGQSRPGQQPVELHRIPLFVEVVGHGDLDFLCGGG